jgi:hypothetical protein
MRCELTTRDSSSVAIKVCHESHSANGIPPGRGESKIPAPKAKYPSSACLLNAYVMDQHDGTRMIRMARAASGTLPADSHSNA